MRCMDRLVLYYCLVVWMHGVLVICTIGFMKASTYLIHLIFYTRTFSILLLTLQSMKLHTACGTAPVCNCKPLHCN